VIAVRTADRDKPWVATLVKAYHSAEVKGFIQTQFKNSVVPSW
jgi:D-methionine transport system substrate-binding protein